MDAIEIRNDDVLVTHGLTRPMKNAMRHKPLFEWFVETDKWFEEINIKTILAVLADGVDENPEWVRYIKERQHRFIIGLHGHTHTNYKGFSFEEAWPLLKQAKEKLETAFEVPVNRFFFPFALRGVPPWVGQLEEKGLSFHGGLKPVPHFYFHYWNPRSVEKIKRIIEKHGK